MSWVHTMQARGDFDDCLKINEEYLSNNFIKCHCFGSVDLSLGCLQRSADSSTVFYAVFFYNIIKDM